MTSPRSGRALGLACLGLAVCAGLLWGASALVWFRGPPRAVVGSVAAPSLTGFALVALAGVAALVATGGVVRRICAGLLAVAGVAGVWTGGQALTGAGATPAPLLAVLGGLVLVVVGAGVVWREPRLSRLGARYAAPDRRPPVLDPDRAAWQDLDAGRDPTADTDGTVGHDPGDGARRGPI